MGINTFSITSCRVGPELGWLVKLLVDGAVVAEYVFKPDSQTDGGMAATYQEASGLAIGWMVA